MRAWQLTCCRSLTCSRRRRDTIHHRGTLVRSNRGCSDDGNMVSMLDHISLNGSDLGVIQQSISMIPSSSTSHCPIRPSIVNLFSHWRRSWSCLTKVLCGLECTSSATKYRRIIQSRARRRKSDLNWRVDIESTWHTWVCDAGLQLSTSPYSRFSVLVSSSHLIQISEKSSSMTVTLSINVDSSSHSSPSMSLFTLPMQGAQPFLDKKRRRAGSRNHIPTMSQHAERCLVTGDLATESPVYLCHVFHERYWNNHPLVSCSRNIHLLRLN